MAKVEVNAAGRYVVVEQDGAEATELVKLAQEAWDHTAGAQRPSEGAAVGFRDERRWTPHVEPTNADVRPAMARG